MLDAANFELRDGLELRLFGVGPEVERFKARRVEGRWVYLRDDREISAERWKKEAKRAQRRWLSTPPFGFLKLSVNRASAHSGSRRTGSRGVRARGESPPA